MQRLLKNAFSWPRGTVILSTGSIWGVNGHSVMNPEVHVGGNKWSSYGSNGSVRASGGLRFWSSDFNLSVKDLVDKIGIFRMVCCSVELTLSSLLERSETVTFKASTCVIGGLAVGLKTCLTNFFSEIYARSDFIQGCRKFTERATFILTITLPDDMFEIVQVNKKLFQFISLV